MSTAPLKQIVTVLNPEGLHLRPADLLVRAASQFQASILIGKNAEMVDCKSILSLMTLGADQGTQLTIQAEGSDAAEAMQRLAALFATGFVVESDPGDSGAAVTDVVTDVNDESQFGSNLGSGPEPGTAHEQTL